MPVLAEKSSWFFMNLEMITVLHSTLKAKPFSRSRNVCTAVEGR